MTSTQTASGRAAVARLRAANIAAASTENVARPRKSAMTPRERFITSWEASVDSFAASRAVVSVVELTGGEEGLTWGKLW